MKEWIITNGLGGFDSTTTKGGMNERRYHGLLIAPLQPPRQRTLILSKVDESIEINSKKYNLYTNDVDGKITEGYKYQTKFEKDIIPVYTYNVNGIIIEKSIYMIYGKNAVVVNYKISNNNSRTKFEISPIMNFRDFHLESHASKFKFKQTSLEDAFTLTFDKKYKVHVLVNGAKFTPHKNDIFYNMHYAREEERGFDCKENHIVPGTFEIKLKRNENKEVTFVCSLEKNGLKLEEMRSIIAEDVIKNEVKRINDQIEESKLLTDNNISKSDDLFKSKNNYATISSNGNRRKKKEESEDAQIYDELVKRYIVSSDNFIAYRKFRKLHTTLAGFPWFLDWGRDSFISFEGLLLLPRRFEIAREVLLTFALKHKNGLLPNGFSEYDGHPLYNSVDSALLFIDAVDKYLKYTNDYQFVNDKLYKIMKNIINSYIDGIEMDGNNIYLDDKDYLLVSGTPSTQNTWMDAKVDGKPVTPRNGKAVEINAMWYNALKIMENLSSMLGKRFKRVEYSYIAKKCKESFEKEFYDENKKCLYDVIKVERKEFSTAEVGKDDKIRPNQLFAISMTNPVIDPNSEVGKNIFITVTEKLYNAHGLQTLASDEEGFASVYKGNPSERDRIYHQGVTWPWLLGPYYDALKNVIKYEEDKNIKDDLNKTLMEFRLKTAKTFYKELTSGTTVNGIPELYDSILDNSKTKVGKGAFQQAWSVSEVFRIIFGA